MNQKFLVHAGVFDYLSKSPKKEAAHTLSAKRLKRREDDNVDILILSEVLQKILKKSFHPVMGL